MPRKPSEPRGEGIHRVLALQLQALRKKRGGQSQQRLADRMTELGHPTQQATVARIESGERAISVAELFALAAALDVAPVELLGASFDPQDVPVVGKLKLTPRATRGWIRGNRSLPDGDERLYYEQVSDEQAEANRRVPGLMAYRGFVDDYEEAALRDDVAGMDATLQIMQQELERKRQLLEYKPEHWTPERQRRRQKRDEKNG